MKYSEIKGNLFSADAKFAFAHAISSDAALGKGVALQLKHKYPHMHAHLKSMVGKPFMQVGQCVACNNSDGRVILNLISKPIARYKPKTKQGLKEAIKNMKSYVLKNNINHIAMPLVGAGLDAINNPENTGIDGEDWIEIRAFIQELFSDTDIEIMVYYL